MPPRRQAPAPVRPRSDLEAYQNAAVGFIKEKKRCALFVDPGLGKTISTLTALGDLIADLECGTTLIVAPPRVAKKTWPDEFGEWAHTRGYSFVHIKGTPEKRRRLLKRKVWFHIISVDLLPWLLNELGGHAPDTQKVNALLGGDEVVKGFEDDRTGALQRKALIDYGYPAEKLEGKDEFQIAKIAEREAAKENRWAPPKQVPYDAIVVDESTKVKTHSASRFKAIKAMCRLPTYFLILTGTPASNGLKDLWAQIYLLDFGVRLGANITAFLSRWFRKGENGFGQVPIKGAAEEIESAISDIVFTLREEDYAKLPPRLYNKIVLEFDDATLKKYRKFERDCIIELSEEKTLSVNKGAAISNKLQQLANGFVYDHEKVPHAFHRIKLDALQDIVDEVQGQPVLVAYQFIEDAERILKAFKGAELFKTTAQQDRWNAGEIPMLLVHPKSAAHGLNLQFGGNVAVWYGMTWSLEDYIQLNKRLHRKGQTRPVMIHQIIVEGTVDEDMNKALDGKNDMQEALLTALKNRIERYV